MTHCSVSTALHSFTSLCRAAVLTSVRSMNPQQVADRVEIQAALTRYATGVDSKNWELWRSVFTEDADVDYTQSTPLRGTPGELAEWYAQNFTEAAVPW